MGTLIFWGIFVLLIAIAISGNIRRSRLQKDNRLKEIEEYFGVKHTGGSETVSDNVKGYYKHYVDRLSDEEFAIDDITWNDLELDCVYNNLNTLFTSAGEELMYKNMRVMHMNSDIPGRMYKSARRYIEDSELRINVSKQLDKLGKVRNIDSFDIIKKLFKAQKYSVLKDIVIDIILLLSFAVIFIIPSVGMLLFIASLIAAISTYFSQKAVMDENLKAFGYVIKLINCSNLIDKITGEVSLCSDRLRNINSLTFLMSQKDGTTSNPLTIIMDYIRMIFHVDIIAYNIKLNIIAESKAEIFDIYEHIGNIDCEIAVASYMKSMSDVCEPVYVISGNIINAKDMYHPLTKTVVTNDIHTQRGVLITGSNASGKSTFLKMLGVNIIFAQCFGFALARHFEISPVRLFTSMALKDNLLGEESYYIVETKSLKRICDASDEYGNVLGIVDEVLRGTNTIERIAASYCILKYLSDKNVLCFVATHDSELTDLLAQYYEMYYFTEEVQKDAVVFPYKINSGVSKKGNAIKLLDIMGYDNGIVSRALNVIDNFYKTGKWEEV